MLKHVVAMLLFITLSSVTPVFSSFLMFHHYAQIHNFVALSLNPGCDRNWETKREHLHQKGADDINWQQNMAASMNQPRAVV